MRAEREGLNFRTNLDLVLALALNRDLIARTFLRSLYFLPVVSSAVAVGLVWNWIYARDTGLLNGQAGTVGIAAERRAASHADRMIAMASDRLFRGVTHRWAYLSVTGVMTPGSTAHLDMLRAFVRDLHPLVVAP